MKASKLAKLLLKHPDAEVYVQEYGSTYVHPMDDTRPEVRVDRSGEKPKTVLVFAFEPTDWRRLDELRPINEKPEPPSERDPVIIRSKSTGRIINMKW